LPVQAVELVLTAFLLVMLIAQIAAKKARVPYTLVLVFVGLAFSALASISVTPSNAIADALQSAILQVKTLFTSLAGGGLFVGLVVSPLIFEAMIHVEATNLRAVVRPSIVLATVGVLVATLIGGLVLWQLVGVSFTAAFLFAAIVAPTDVVTVLEIFRRLNVPTKLATLMETEAAFNDATAIVVFSIVVSSIGVAGVPIFSAIPSFGVAILGGVVVGFLVALPARRISSLTEDKIAETILTISAVYGSYVFATGIGVSGLIAVAVVGLYFGNVTMKATKWASSKEAVTTFWEIAAFVGNSIAFLLIGLETNVVFLVQSGLLVLVAYGAVIVARAASVYPILALFSKVGERIPLTWSNTAMLGGMRGALSIALVASLAGSALLSESDIQTITTMVVGVTFLSIVIQAPLLARYVRGKFEQQQQLNQN
jgi:monovalent cation:H+ antiporter, CPA1 family